MFSQWPRVFTYDCVKLYYMIGLLRLEVLSGCPEFNALSYETNRITLETPCPDCWTGPCSPPQAKTLGRLHGPLQDPGQRCRQEQGGLKGCVHQGPEHGPWYLGHSFCWLSDWITASGGSAVSVPGATWPGRNPSSLSWTTLHHRLPVLMRNRCSWIVLVSLWHKDYSGFTQVPACTAVNPHISFPNAPFSQEIPPGIRSGQTVKPAQFPLKQQKG